MKSKTKNKFWSFLLNTYLKIIICVVVFIFIILVETIMNIRGSLYQITKNELNNWLNGQNQRFYVKTSTCQMLYVNPYESDAMSIFNPQKYRKCAKDKDLVTVIYNRRTHQHRLKLLGKANETMSGIVCCYQRIVRGKNRKADKTIKLHKCKNFATNFIVPARIDAVIVNCKTKKKNLQRLAFSFVHWKPSNVSAKQRNTTATKTNNATQMRVPSVLIMGIDSLSRSNFRRNMPWTNKYFEKNKWFELEGYNKMGDNTFPNLMALLTGYSQKQAFEFCNPQSVDGLSICNFVWHKYKEHGYKTAYAEDAVGIETFNYQKMGFLKPPTDYYLRPFLIGISRHLRIRSRNEKHYCVGRKHYAEYIFDYAEQFITVYSNAKLFGLFWVNSFSHNEFDAPASMDDRFVEYLRTFEARGAFERSIVFFLSDHGMRFGPLRLLKSGYLEERLPVLFVSLPLWFQQAQPDFVAALKVNRNRLTSPYDIHMTLQHILELSTPGLKYAQAQGCANCQSVFHVIPENRTCTDAGIDKHWCTCDYYQHVDKHDETVVTIAELIIVEINRFLVEQQYSNCSSLELHSIKYAEQQLANGQVSYRIMFDAKPKRPLFQATALYDLKHHSIDFDLATISRINSYQAMGKCVQQESAQKLCVCLT